MEKSPFLVSFLLQKARNSDTVFAFRDWMYLLLVVSPTGIVFWRGTMEFFLAANSAPYYALMVIVGALIEVTILCPRLGAE